MITVLKEIRSNSIPSVERNDQEMKKSFLIFMLLFLHACALRPNVSVKETTFRIFPSPAIFLSEKVEKDQLFKKSLSKDGSGDDKALARDLFLDTFRKHFPNSTDQMEHKNRFDTFMAFLHITRVSRYEIPKTEKLVDLYLPITMSINFVNVGTGELIYSYPYTYYSVYRTTPSSRSDAEIAGLYRKTYKSLMDTILEKAKENFHPFTIEATIKKIWRDYYILNVGKDKGIDDQDILVDQYGNQLKVEYAALKYSVGTKILGDPKSDSTFLKFSNESIDEIKKPRIMPLSIHRGGVESVSDEIIFHLFSETLAKKATFSLTSKEKNFIKVRNLASNLTNVSQTVQEERRLPDYFLRLYFYGPFYASIPTNKQYVSLDNYEILACADILDTRGRILYSKCAEDKISDQVVANIRFANEAREEVVVKNSLIKLANDLIQDIKFKDLEFPIIKSASNQLMIEDGYNILIPGATLKTFTNIGKIDGIEGNVYVPTWEVNVATKDNKKVWATRNLPLTSKMPQPSVGDMVFLNNLKIDNGDITKTIKMCLSDGRLGGDLNLDGFKHLSMHAISAGTKYPFFASEEFKKDAERYNNPGHGFKGIKIEGPKSGYCIEPVYRITQKEKNSERNSQFDSYRLAILAGIKIYDGNKLIWKKGLEQELTIHAPKGYQKAVLNMELSKNIYRLLNYIAKKIEIRN